MTLAHGMITAAIVKPIVTGGIVGVVEKFYFKNGDKESLLTAGAVAIGVLGTSWVEPLTNNLFPTKTATGAGMKFLEGRIVEIACASGACYGLTRFVFKTEMNPNFFLKKIAVIAAADSLAELITDYIVHHNGPPKH
jgi:hypothetical protein